MFFTPVWSILFSDTLVYYFFYWEVIMNLLTILTQLMTSGASINAVSVKTGLSSKQLKKLLPTLIPIVLKYMTGNASSTSGATSLLGALAQHNNKKSMDLQLQEADEEDGSKIIGHIFGKDENKVTADLSAQTGLETSQISQVLSVIAPALMSGVSGAADSAQVSPAGAAPTINLAGSDLFSAFFGMNNPAPTTAPAQKEDPFDGSALLQALLNLKK